VNPLLFLDSGPLGLITHPQRSPEVIAVTEWVKQCILAGVRIVVPAIVYYEIKRELLRARKDLSVARLDAFVNAVPGRYIPLTDEALRLAAEMWTQSRQAGRLTADLRALDIDVLLAAQLLSLGTTPALIATTNPKHLSQLAPARHWTDITPGIFGKG
jgi:hypothetical protein